MVIEAVKERQRYIETFYSQHPRKVAKAETPTYKPLLS
jgi:hypothetical protein